MFLSPRATQTVRMECLSANEYCSQQQYSCTNTDGLSGFLPRGRGVILQGMHKYAYVTAEHLNPTVLDMLAAMLILQI